MLFMATEPFLIDFPRLSETLALLLAQGKPGRTLCARHSW
jgi:hypothetical protein